MTKKKLKKVLKDSKLFEEHEIKAVLDECGTFTLGRALVVMLVLLRWHLSGNDIDILIATSNLLGS